MQGIGKTTKDEINHFREAIAGEFNSQVTQAVAQ